MHGHICTCIIQQVHCPLCTLRTSCMVPLCNFHLFPQWDVRTSGTMWCQLWGRIVARGSRQGKAAAWTLSLRHPRAYGLLERLPHHCRCYSFLASVAQVCGTEQCCHITRVRTFAPPSPPLILPPSFVSPLSPSFCTGCTVPHSMLEWLTSSPINCAVPDGTYSHHIRSRQGNGV